MSSTITITSRTPFVRDLASAAADARLLQGRYFEPDGCGCMVAQVSFFTPQDEGEDMSANQTVAEMAERAEKNTGIPAVVWRMCEVIFEGLPLARAYNFAKQFCEAIQGTHDFSRLRGMSLKAWKARTANGCSAEKATELMDHLFAQLDASRIAPPFNMMAWAQGVLSRVPPLSLPAPLGNEVRAKTPEATPQREPALA